jgi:hypothetical protein
MEKGAFINFQSKKLKMPLSGFVGLKQAETPHFLPVGSCVVSLGCS